MKFAINAVAPGHPNLEAVVEPEFITIEKLKNFLARRNVFVYHSVALEDTIMFNTEDRPDADEEGDLL